MDSGATPRATWEHLDAIFGEVATLVESNFRGTRVTPLDVAFLDRLIGDDPRGLF